MHFAILPFIGVVLIIVIIWAFIRYVNPPQVVVFVCYGIMAAVAIIWVGNVFGLWNVGQMITLT